MVSKYIGKKCSTSLASKEMQIKIMRCHFILVRVTNAIKEVDKGESLYTVGGNIK